MKRILIPILLLATNALAVVRYVDNAAPGGGNGQSWATAWNALSQITGVGAGDTVYVSGGTTSKTYSLSTGYNPPDGNSSAQFTIAIGQEAGHNGQAIFNGTSGGGFLVGTNYFTFDGRGPSNERKFRVQGFEHMALSTAATGPVRTKLLGVHSMSKIRMDDATETEIGWCTFGGDTMATKVVWSGGPGWIQNLARAETTMNTLIHDNIANMWYIHGVNAQGNNGDDFIQNIGACEIYNNVVIARFATDGLAGANHQDFLQTGVSNMRIYNNYWENASNYMLFIVQEESIAGRDVQNIQIYNNVFNYSDPVLTSQPSQAIAFSQKPPNTADYINCYIVNNTFRGGNQAIAFGSPTAGGNFTNSHVRNNLTMTGTGAINVNGSGATISNNVTNVPSNYFVNAANRDFRLTSSASGAINTGANLSGLSPALGPGGTSDQDGTPRGSAWDVGAFEFGSVLPDTTPPTLESASIDAAGTTLTRTFSEAVNTSSADNAGWSISASGGAVTGTYASGSPTNVINYTLSRAINADETVTTTYTQPGNGVEDTTGNDLASISSPVSVTNNSTQGILSAATFSPVAGSYFGTQSVTLGTTESGATIYYTTDGSTPTHSSPVYSSAIAVSTNQTVKALVGKTGSLDSPVASASYEVNSWATSNQFKSFAVPSQTASFPWNFRFTPSAANSNSVIGLSPIAVSGYPDMSCIVRFSDTGSIDAFNNTGYAAVNPVTYTAGTAYTFACSINMANNTYSVTVTPQGGSATVIAQDYVFRSTQPDPSELDNIGLMTVNGTGLLENMTLGNDLIAPTPNPATFASAPAPVNESSISMTATTATDDFNNPTQYFFDETSGASGGSDSGWQSSASYTDSGLSASTLYTYRVKARDALLNETAYSNPLSATTSAPPPTGKVNASVLNVGNLQITGQ